MTDLVVTALAVLWAWELVLVATPWRIPAILQPLLVVGLSYGATLLPQEARFAGAVAGAVAIFHVGLRALAETELPPVQARNLIGRGSERPRGVGNRVPDLP